MIERENTPMTTSSDVIAGLELALASADAMIERLQGERAILRDSVIEALQLAHDHMRLYLPHYTEKHNVFDTVTRALKSQLAAPDPRDEVIRQQAKRIAELEKIADALRDDSINKIMAASDEQINALCRMEGSNPEDVAKLTKKVMELAVANATIKKQAEALRVAREALDWCVEQGGGPKCEHDAGVCFCKENKALAAIDKVMKG